MRQSILALGACVLLAGCAHQVTLTPLDGGPSGHGSAPQTLIRNDGKLTISLDGKTYEGDYVYVPEGGIVGFGSSFSGGQVATGTLIGAPMSGGGRANLRASDGSTLRCEFHYSSYSATGLGGCEGGDGRKFDLAIR